MQLNRRQAVLALVACGAIAAPTMALASRGSAARSHTVTLQNIRFHPGSVSIKRGDSITWQWRDGGIEHNVTFSRFHSRTQGTVRTRSASPRGHVPLPLHDPRLRRHGRQGRGALSVRQPHS
jgi:plastocyanin